MSKFVFQRLFFEGQLLGQVVSVQDMTLFEMGFFGKGSLSQRSLDDKKPQQQQQEEYLYLTLQEAFYLQYALGCLAVRNWQTKQPFSMTELFTQCCALEGHDYFVSRYVIYHMFRSKGYVVRCGLKYGSDFVVYKKGPGLDHALYSVNVVLEKDEQKGNMLTWKDLHHHSRLNVNVAKQLLLCRVALPESSDMAIKDYLQSCQVETCCITRFVPKRERD